MKNYPQLTLNQFDGTVVEIKTNKGDITVKLFDELVPKTVKNFVGLIKNNYYNGVSFHRVIKDFMIQGGDPTGTGRGGESFFGKPFEDEITDQLFHFRGALSMANAGPNTNGSQFFIVQASNVSKEMFDRMDDSIYNRDIIDEYTSNGGTPWLDGKHTVFGQVISGMDIIDEIADVRVGPMDKPIFDVIITEMTIK